MTADFQRFYGLRIVTPDEALEEYGCVWLTRLMDGLEGYDESLYREWTLTNSSETETDGDKAIRLSYHSYSQQTMLAALQLQRLDMIANVLIRDDKGNPLLDPLDIRMPGDREAQPVEATYETMQAFMLG